jgi:hypothetical protein
MTKEMDCLNDMRELIHKQRQAIDEYVKMWENKIESVYDLARMTSEFFIRIFAIMSNFYMNLESMYIANEAWSNQIDLLKNAIFELKEVKTVLHFRTGYDLFSSYNKVYLEQYKSFIRSYGNKKK